MNGFTKSSDIRIIVDKHRNFEVIGQPFRNAETRPAFNVKGSFNPTGLPIYLATKANTCRRNFFFLMFVQCFSNVVSNAVSAIFFFYRVSVR